MLDSLFFNPIGQGYTNKYNLISCERKRELLSVLEKGPGLHSIYLFDTPGSSSNCRKVYWIDTNLSDMQKIREHLFISQALQLPFGLSIRLYLFL